MIDCALRVVSSSNGGPASGSSPLGFGIRVHGLLEGNAELFAYALELLEVFFVLALVLDLVFDACMQSEGAIYRGAWLVDVPSKTRTAEGKSLTRLAARRAEIMTEGEGTRS